MRHKIMYLCVALVFIGVLLVCLGSVSALKVKRITNDIDVQYDVEVSNDYIVWRDNKYGDYEIFSYDLKGSKGVQRVTNTPTDDIHPHIFNDHLIWSRSFGYELMYKNLTDQNTYTIYNASGNVAKSDIWGNWIVFADESMAWPNDILLYKYNINTKTVFPLYYIPGGNAYLQNLEIVKNNVMVHLYSDTDSYIIFIDVNNDQVITNLTLPAGTGTCKLGEPNGKFIICNNYFSRYFKWDMTSSQFTGLEFGTLMGNNDDFSISNDKVLFINMSTDEFGMDLFLYDIQTREEVRLTYSPSKLEMNLVIFGQNIAFISVQDIFPDIFYMQIPINPPDLLIKDDDVHFDPAVPIAGEPSTLHVNVKNAGKSVGEGTLIVKFKELEPGGGPQIFTMDTGPILAGDFAPFIFDNYNNNYPGRYQVDIRIEQIVRPQQFDEIDTSNNQVLIDFYVNEIPTPVIDQVDPIEALTYEDLDLTAFGSYDFDEIMIYSWDFGDGLSSLGPEVIHHWKKAGTYNVVLTVMDSYLATNSTTRVVNVINQPPIVVHNVPNILPRNVDVVLSALGSTDPDGEVKEVIWDIDETDTVHGMVATYSFTQADQYVTINLTVMDDDDDISFMVFTVELVDSTDRNIPPVAVINVNGNGGFLTFTGNGSYDPNGDITSFEWTFGEGDTASGDTVTHNFAEGTHFITLTVTDDEGLSNSAIVAITINYTSPPEIIQKLFGNTTVVNKVEGNEAPTLSASFEITDEENGDVSFTGTGTDPDGNITKYQWDFDGDGVWDYTSSTTGSATNTYDMPGFYLAVFKVTDENGTSAVTVLSVAINTGDIGGPKNLQRAPASVLDPMMLIIVIVIAVVVAVVVAVAAAKKFSRSEMDLATQQEVDQLQKLVNDTRATGAQVDEAEALIRELEGR